MFLIFRIKQNSCFLKSVSPEANLELRPTDTCQFPQFFSEVHPLTRCSANGNFLKYEMGVREVYRHCSINSDNFSLSVMQMELHGGW